MADKRPALGRGLSALIPDAAAPAAGRDRPFEIDLDRLTPNPHQPRSVFDEAKLEELAQSIRASGMIQPIIARRARARSGADSHDRFEIVAGERRWRAAQRAGLMKAPVVIRDVPDERLLEVALIENLQRDDLNPIEEAAAYKRLIDELKLTQDAVATAVGKDRSSITNTLRLLKLPDEVRNLVSGGSLAMGHARALLGLDSAAAQRQLAREIVAKDLSVRETEALVKRQTGREPAVTPPARKKTDPNTRAAEEKLRFALGTDVEIVRRGKGGRIEITFKTEEELDRLYEKLTGN